MQGRGPVTLGVTIAAIKDTVLLAGIQSVLGIVMEALSAQVNKAVKAIDGWVNRVDKAL